jgi:putative endonuclease
MTPAPSSQAQGQLGETTAAKYLQQQGLAIIFRNYSCKQGELDIIAKQDSCWVFVEVKLRRTNRFGGAVASITAAKKRRLIATAQCYLSQHKLNSVHTEMRFDVITITQEPYQICWFKNAFGE